MGEWLKRKGVLAVAIVLIGLMGASVWYLSERVQEDRSRKFADRIRTFFHDDLRRQKSQALSLAIALADNKALKEALENDDEDLGYEVLSSTFQRLQSYTPMRGVRAQVITPDLTIFARSWDNTYAGMPLDIFREDLREIVLLKKPRVAIESGRMLSIKATVPIKRGAKTIGYLEVLQFFDRITEDLRRHSIELLVLMEDRLLDIATLMRENPVVDGYVVSNQNFNIHLKKVVERIDLNRLFRDRYLIEDDFLFLSEDMFNGRGERLGVFLMAISKQDLEMLMYADKPLSFFLNFTPDDLYKIVNRWENPTGGYRSIYDKNLLKLLDTFEGEDRALVLEEIREVLGEYSKEELIDIILRQHRRKKIRGEIR